jgi:uncharacterized membrane protein (DUF2068 family)
VSVKDEVRRPDFGLRVIIFWKAFKGTLLVAVSITAFLMVHSDVHDLAMDAVDWLGIDPATPRMVHLLDSLDTLTPRKITMVGIGAAVVAMVMFIEAWGLHRRRTWAEWLTVFVTASLIPFEIYHLAIHPSIGKVITLVANVAIVVYLLRHRWLFMPGRIRKWWKRRRAAPPR